MNYEQLQLAVMDAYRQADPTQVLGIMDQFIETAQGSDLGHALCLKASFLMHHDQRRCTEGLSLVEEALTVAAEDPGLQMKCVVDGLGFCFSIGDAFRAKRFEMLGHNILREHDLDPMVRNMSYRMYINLAHIATLRQEPTQAYWHLVQAAQILSTFPADNPDIQSFRFRLYLKTAEVGAEMGRRPESEDALMKARDCMLSDADELNWLVIRASHLHAIHHDDSAAELLDGLAERVAACNRPSVQIVFHLTRSMAAEVRGEIRLFHHHLAKARDLAVAHGLDYMLCRIQRVMRSPVRLEVAK